MEAVQNYKTHLLSFILSDGVRIKVIMVVIASLYKVLAISQILCKHDEMKNIDSKQAARCVAKKEITLSIWFILNR